MHVTNAYSNTPHKNGVMKIRGKQQRLFGIGSVTGGHIRHKNDDPHPLILTGDLEASPMNTKEADDGSLVPPLVFRKPMRLMYTNRESGSIYDGGVDRNIARGVDGKINGATHMPVVDYYLPTNIKMKNYNTNGHRGGLVHHKIHYPNSHRGGLIHEELGSKINTGSDGMPVAHTGGQQSSFSGASTQLEF